MDKKIKKLIESESTRKLGVILAKNAGVLNKRIINAIPVETCYHTNSIAYYKQVGLVKLTIITTRCKRREFKVTGISNNGRLMAYRGDYYDSLHNEFINLVING